MPFKGQRHLRKCQNEKDASGPLSVKKTKGRSARIHERTKECPNSISGIIATERAQHRMCKSHENNSDTGLWKLAGETLSSPE